VNANENDQITEDEQETEDETSEEDTAAAENIDLRSLGVDPLSTPISDLLKLYRENHATVQDYAKKQKSGKSDPNDVSQIVKANVTKVLKSDDTEVKARVSSVREVGSAIADETFSSLEKMNGLVPATVLLDELRNLVSLVEDEVRYHFDNAVQKMKDEKGIKETPSESAIVAKLTCVKLRSLIENRVNIAQLVDPSSIPDNLLKTATEGKRGGFNTEVFPKTPRLDMGDAAPSPSSSVHLVFRFVKSDGTEVAIPDGTTLRQVAHDYISSGAYRVTGREVEQLLKKSGYGIGATDTEWSLSFKTGVLYGKKSG
jgi:hypothetical protein